jgi:integrase
MDIAFNIRAKGKQFYIVLNCHADDGRVRKSLGSISTPDNIPKPLKNMMDRLRMRIESHVSDARLSNKPVLKADIDSIIANEKRGKIKPVIASNYPLGDMCADFYNLVSKQGILNSKGRHYSEDAIKTIRVASNILLSTSLKDKPIESITSSDIEEYKRAVISYGLSQNTLFAYTHFILLIINRTNALGWHKNTIEINKIASERVDYHIALTPNEIDLIYNYNATGIEREIIDYFVFGCNVGQRNNDLSQIIPDSYHNGYISIITRKKGVKASIPVNKHALEIWNKYKGVLPIYGEEAIKKHIRAIAKAVGITAPTLFSRTSGGKLHQSYVPRYELIGTHTMRRSFATNAVKSGVPPKIIMSITGHTSEPDFWRYVRITQSEYIGLSKGYEFFK